MQLRIRPAVTLTGIMMLQTACAVAQGLVFNLPDDGTGVLYEGKMVQEIIRTELAEGKEVLSWSRELSIKSVGQEEAEFEGVVQPCRWIEIKVVTGKAEASGIDTGPVGDRIYKVLVPENRIAEFTASSGSGSVLPIVRGFRRLGEEDVETINSRGLVVYPTLSLLASYESPTVVSQSDEIESIGDREIYDCRHLKGQTVRERADSRSTNVGEFWLSQDVPFGLASWSVRVVREAKGSSEPRNTFRQVGSITCDMKVREVLRAAESELITE